METYPIQQSKYLRREPARVRIARFLMSEHKCESVVPLRFPVCFRSIFIRENSVQNPPQPCQRPNRVFLREFVLPDPHDAPACAP